MIKSNLLSIKKMTAAVTAALVFSSSFYAQALISSGDDASIQCISNGSQTICCTGGPHNMTCEIYDN